MTDSPKNERAFSVTVLINSMLQSRKNCLKFWEAKLVLAVDSKMKEL